MSGILRVENLSKSFDDPSQRVRALHNLTFSIEEGEFVCLLGPSGSGKSTLLRMIAGLVQADSGEMYLRDEAIAQPRREIALVFQTPTLMPWRTVLENVLLPAQVQGGVDDAAASRAHDLLALMGLSEFAGALPRQLSGGMAQRAALARTLMLDPQVLLLDEPFGALDAMTRERLNLELLRLHEEEGRTMLMVTHDIAEAVLLADRVLLLSHRPGTLVADLRIPLARPRTLEMTGTAEFAALTLEVRKRLSNPDQ